MSVYNQRFLTPPDEEEEVDPYRTIWRSFSIENGLLAVLTVAVFVVFGLFKFQVGERLTLAVSRPLWSDEVRHPQPGARRSA